MIPSQFTRAKPKVLTDIVVFESVSDIINVFNSKHSLTLNGHDMSYKSLQYLKFQLDTLIRTSFPKYFPCGGSFIDNMNALLQSRKIKDDDVCTLLAIQYKNKNLSHCRVVGCVQLVKEQTSAKANIYRIINLCRKKDKEFRGIGKKLLTAVIEYSDGFNPKPMCIHLSVSANNTKLQAYYQRYGWTNTYKYNNQCETEPAYDFIFFK